MPNEGDDPAQQICLKQPSVESVLSESASLTVTTFDISTKQSL